MPRELDAYSIPAAILIGIAIHEMLTAFSILIRQYDHQVESTQFRLTLSTWVTNAVYIAVQTTFLDYFVSPYGVSAHWVGTILMVGFLFCILTNIGIFASYLYKNKMSASGNLRKSFLLFVFVSGMLKAIACILGITISIEIATQKLQRFPDHPLEPLIFPFFASSMLIECFVFSILPITILYKRNGRDDRKWFSLATYLSEIQQTPRLFVLLLNNIGLFLFTMIAMSPAGSHHLSQWILYAPSLKYAFELRTVLHLDYETNEDFVQYPTGVLISEKHLPELPSVTRRSPIRLPDISLPMESLYLPKSEYSK
jgi:hypothetical protein